MRGIPITIQLPELVCDARSAEQEENWELAANLWDQCIRHFGTGEQPWWHSNYARAMMELQRDEEAESVLRKLLRDHPDYPPGYASLATFACRQGKWEESAELWKICLDRFPDGAQPGWYTNYARALTELGKYQEAESILKAVIDKSPGFSSAHSTFADLAHRQQAWEESAERWETCIRLFDQGGQPGWHTNYARALIELRRYDEAESVLTEVIGKNPHFPFALSCFADLAHRQGSWEEAAKRWETCIGLFDDGARPGWHTNHARALIELNKYQEAEDLLLGVVSSHPDYTFARVCLADLAYRRKSWGESVERWARLCRRLDDGQHPEWYVQYARSLIELEKYDDAEAVLSKVINNNPDFAPAWSCRATLASRRQQWERAVELWTECIERFAHSDIQWWSKSLAHALVKLERYDEAHQIYLDMNDEGCDDYIVLANLAKISFLRKDLDACLGYAATLRNRYPSERSGYRWGEEALIKLGRFREAADVHLAWPGGQARSDRPFSLPENYPQGLLLPPIVGNGNDYGFIEEKVAVFEQEGGGYHIPVSIIVPVYNRVVMLSRTLAALTHQTYPGRLIEVIVADDGSSDDPQRVVEKYSDLLNVKYVRQEDQGYRLAAVRNLGIKEAEFDHLIFLDCDVIPVPELVEAYMRYFHVTDKAALVGLRRYICADNVSDDDLLADPEIIKKLPDIWPAHTESTIQTMNGRLFDWREALLARSDDLKKEIFPFRAFVGCNAAFPRSVIDSIGFFDEDFTSWGGEDIEFGYRIYNQGFYFIPVKGALGLHQEPSSDGNDFQIDRSAGKTESQPIFEDKCPLPSVRKYQPGVVYQVPKVSIYIPAYNVSKYIEKAVDSALGQSYTDLEVVICNDGSTDDTLTVLEKVYCDNPRVRWITQSNLGIAAATNAAINACRGMYIGQLDGDDELYPNAVETMVDYLDRENDGLVYGCDARIDRDGNLMRKNECVPFSREHLLVSNICTPFRMFRKRDWMRIGGCDVSLENAVDYDLMQKLSEVCSVAHIPELMYGYRIHGENTSLYNREVQEDNHLIVVNNALKRMGLFNTWLAVSGADANKRKLRFMRIK